MADLPEATVLIDDEAGALASGTNYVAVLACAQSHDDMTPRVFASTKDMLDYHLYSRGVDYCALHFEETGLPVIFVGLPEATAGALGYQDQSGVTGNAAITVAAGSGGIQETMDGILTVTAGGTVGTSQITFDLSLDGGDTTKSVRLGTAASYTIPYVGLTLNFGAGTLVADDVYTFRTTAPRSDQAGLAAAKTALANQNKQMRSWLLVGDLLEEDDATDFLTELNGYETANDRFVFGRGQARDRYAAANMSRRRVFMKGAPSLTFAEVGVSGDTITRATGSWITDGFAAGDTITITGSLSNNISAVIASLSATVITLGSEDLAAEVTAVATIYATPTLTFAEVGVTGDTLTRSAGSWVVDGFKIGDVVAVTGSVSNNVSGAVTAVSATVLTFGSTDLAAEVIASFGVSVTVAQESGTAWKSDIDAEFADIDDSKRIDLGAGYARKLSPISGWRFRRPVQWAASIREYQHDVQIPNWRKSDGPVFGWDLEDDDGNTVEHDERINGGLLAARFTCFRTYSNGPNGTFVALSLTRALEGSLLSRTHNMAVANVACTVVQSETENAIGQVLELNADGTGAEAALVALEERVNSALAIALLQRRIEGPRASFAKWSASRTDILNIPAAELTGTLDLRLNGTLEKIRTRVRVQTAG